MRSRRESRMMSDINVTPFVDVMLVLLVIFMITAPLMQTGLDVDLPQESAGTVDSKEFPTVTLKNNRTIFWNQKKLETLPELSHLLADYLSTDKEGGVFFRADKSLDYGFVVKVMATIRTAGVKKIAMMTDPEL